VLFSLSSSIGFYDPEKMTQKTKEFPLCGQLQSVPSHQQLHSEEPLPAGWGPTFMMPL
jgi:hypothetical protein